VLRYFLGILIVSEFSFLQIGGISPGRKISSTFAVYELGDFFLQLVVIIDINSDIHKVSIE